MAKQFRFAINSILKDEVTGFEGVVMGRTEYSTGCLQYALCPRKLTKEGDPAKWHWFDEERLKDTGKRVKLPGAPKITISIRTLEPGEPIGGPQPTAPER